MKGKKTVRQILAFLLTIAMVLQTPASYISAEDTAGTYETGAVGTTQSTEATTAKAEETTEAETVKTESESESESQSAEATSEAASEATTQQAVQTTAEATSEATTQQAVQTTAEATSEATTQQAAQTTTEATSEATTEQAAQTTTEPTSEATTEPTSEATTQQAAQTTAEPMSETTTQQAAQTTAEPAGETTTGQPSDVTPDTDQLKLNLGSSWYLNSEGQKTALAELTQAVDYSAIPAEILESAEKCTLGLSILFRLKQDGEARTVKAGDYFTVTLPESFTEITLADETAASTGKITVTADDGTILEAAACTIDQNKHSLKFTFFESIENQDVTGIHGEIALSFTMSKTDLADTAKTLELTLQPENIYTLTLPAAPAQDETENGGSGDKQDGETTDGNEANPAGTESDDDAEIDAYSEEDDEILLFSDEETAEADLFNTDVATTDTEVSLKKIWSDNNDSNRPNETFYSQYLHLEFRAQSSTDSTDWTKLTEENKSIFNLATLPTIEVTKSGTSEYTCTASVPESVTSSGKTTTYEWRIVESMTPDNYIQYPSKTDDTTIYNALATTVTVKIEVRDGDTNNEAITAKALQELIQYSGTDFYGVKINGQKSGVSVAATSTTDLYTVTITNLPKYDIDGKEIEYKVTMPSGEEKYGIHLGLTDEDTTDDTYTGDYYAVTYDNTDVPNYGSNSEGAFNHKNESGIIVMTLTGETTYSATKIWKDDAASKNSTLNEIERAAARAARPLTDFELWRYTYKTDEDGNAITTSAQASQVKSKSGLPYTLEASYETDSSSETKSLQLKYSDGGTEAYISEDTYSITFGSTDVTFPKYDADGYPYIYISRETMTNSGDYQSVITDADGNSVSGTSIPADGTITNIKKADETQTAKKVWNAAAFQGQLTDVTVTLKLQRRLLYNNNGTEKSWQDIPVDGKETTEISLSKFNAEILTKTAESSQPKYDESGCEYEYRWVEASVTQGSSSDNLLDTSTGYFYLTQTDTDGTSQPIRYQSTVTKSDDGVYTVTNTIAEMIDVEIIKYWNGNEAEKDYGSVEVTLYQNGKAYTYSKSSAEDTSGSGTDNDETASGETAKTLTEIQNGKISLTYSSENPYKATVTVPKYDENGARYEYTLTEMSGTFKDKEDDEWTNDGYHYKYESKTLNEDGTTKENEKYKAMVYNVPVGTYTYIRVPVKKEWVDDGDDAHRLPVQVQLYYGDSTEPLTLYTDLYGGESADGITLRDGNKSVELTAAYFWYADVYVKLSDLDESFNYASEVDYKKFIAKEISVGDGTIKSKEEKGRYWVTSNAEDLRSALGDTAYNYFVKNGKLSTETGYLLTNNHVYAVTDGAYVTEGVQKGICLVKNRRLGVVNMTVTKTWIDSGQGTEADKAAGGEARPQVYMFLEGVESNIKVSYDTSAEFNTSEELRGTITITHSDGTKETYSDVVVAVMVDITQDSGWSYTFENLPKYDTDGKIYHYQIVEKMKNENGDYVSLDDESVDTDYKATTEVGEYIVGTYHYLDTQSTEVANKRESTTEAVFYKTWEDTYSLNNNTRPDIYLTLYKRSLTSDSVEVTVEDPDDKETAYKATVDEDHISYHWNSGTEADTSLKWTCKFTNLPKYDEYGAVIEYYAKETIAVNNYTVYHYMDVTYGNDTTGGEGSQTDKAYLTLDGTTGFDVAKNGGRFYNSIEKAITISGQKLWKNVPDGYPTGAFPTLILTLYRVKQSVYDTAKKNEEDVNSTSWWKKHSEEVTGYESCDGIQQTELSTKSRVGETNTFTFSFSTDYRNTPLHKYDTETGELYYYHVGEEVKLIEDSSATATALVEKQESEALENYFISNSYVADAYTGEIQVTKNWDDIRNNYVTSSSADDKYPIVTITLKRYVEYTTTTEDADGNKTTTTSYQEDTSFSQKKEIDLNTAGNTTAASTVTFSDLPVYAVDGSRYWYSVSESMDSSVVGYEATSLKVTGAFTDTSSTGNESGDTASATMTTSETTEITLTDGTKVNAFRLKVVKTKSTGTEDENSAAAATFTNEYQDDKVELQFTKEWQDFGSISNIAGLVGNDGKTLKSYLTLMRRAVTSDDSSINEWITIDSDEWDIEIVPVTSNGTSTNSTSTSDNTTGLTTTTYIYKLVDNNEDASNKFAFTKYAPNGVAWEYKLVERKTSETDNNGKPLSYMSAESTGYEAVVSEVSVKVSGTSEEKNSNNVEIYKMTNNGDNLQNVSYKKVSVKKTWKDEKNLHSIRPTSVTMILQVQVGDGSTWQPASSYFTGDKALTQTSQTNAFTVTLTGDAKVNDWTGAEVRFPAYVWTQNSDGTYTKTELNYRYVETAIGSEPVTYNTTNDTAADPTYTPNERSYYAPEQSTTTTTGEDGIKTTTTTVTNELHVTVKVTMVKTWTDTDLKNWNDTLYFVIQRRVKGNSSNTGWETYLEKSSRNSDTSFVWSYLPLYVYDSTTNTYIEYEYRVRETDSSYNVIEDQSWIETDNNVVYQVEYSDTTDTRSEQENNNINPMYVFSSSVKNTLLTVDIPVTKTWYTESTTSLSATVELQYSDDSGTTWKSFSTKQTKTLTGSRTEGASTTVTDTDVFEKVPAKEDRQYRIVEVETDSDGNVKTDTNGNSVVITEESVVSTYQVTYNDSSETFTVTPTKNTTDDSYTASIAYGSSASATTTPTPAVTNTETTSFEITKEWENIANLRTEDCPTTLYYQLYRTTAKSNVGDTAADKSEVVSLADPVGVSAESGTTAQNTNDKQRISVSVTVNSTGTVVNSLATGKVTISNLPKFDSDGHRYYYFAKETSVKYNTASAEANNLTATTYADSSKTNGSFPQNTKITNTLDTISLTVTKQWDDTASMVSRRSMSLTLWRYTQKSDGTANAAENVTSSVMSTAADTITLTADSTTKTVTASPALKSTSSGNTVDSTRNTWTYTFTNLPKKSISGDTYYYKVVETQASGYETPTVVAETTISDTNTGAQSMTIKNTATEFVIRKYDGTTGDLIAASSLGRAVTLSVYKDADCTEKVFDWMYDTNGTYTLANDSTNGYSWVTYDSSTGVITGLPAGDYYVVETQAPSGYAKLSGSYKFTLNADGSLSTDSSSALSVSSMTVSAATATGKTSVPELKVTNTPTSFTLKKVAGDSTTDADIISTKLKLTVSAVSTSKTGEETTITTEPVFIWTHKTAYDSENSSSGYALAPADSSSTGFTGIYCNLKIDPLSGIITGLPAGTYTVKETGIPDGYQKFGDSYTFTINEDGTLNASDETNAKADTTNNIITITDQPIKVQFLKVSEYDESIKDDTTTPTALSGAEFTVTPVNGSKFANTTDSSITVYGQYDSVGDELSGHLIAGNTYKVVEGTAPTGYEKMEEYFTFTINDDGSGAIQSITVYEKNADGSTYAEAADSTIATVISQNSDDTVVIRVTNKPTEVFVYKEDATTSEKLDGATFTVKPLSGSFKDNTASKTLTRVDSGGTVKWEIDDAALEVNTTYILEETVAPDGYELPTYTLYFYLDEQGVVHEGEYSNTSSTYSDSKEYYGVSGKDECIHVKDTPVTVTLTKKDKGDSTLLPGACFELYEGDGIDSTTGKLKANISEYYRGTYTTNSDKNSASYGTLTIKTGNTYTNNTGSNTVEGGGTAQTEVLKLKAGTTYTLAEVTAPDGYELLAPFTFEVNGTADVGGNGKITIGKNVKLADGTTLAVSLVETTTDGQTTTDADLLVKDDPISITLKKVDSDGSTALTGAVFDLYKGTVSSLDNPTSGGAEKIGSFSFGSSSTYTLKTGMPITDPNDPEETTTLTLKQGETYSLVETTAPEGYELLTSAIVFTLDSDSESESANAGDGNIKNIVTNPTLSDGNGAVAYATESDGAGNTVDKKDTLTVKNEKIKLTLNKLDIDTKAEIGTAEARNYASFTVTGIFAGSSTSSTIEGTTKEDANGVSDIENQLAGKLVAGKSYILTETIAPEGYQIPATAFITFIVEADGTVTFTATDAYKGTNTEDATGTSVTADTINVLDQKIELDFLKVDENGDTIGGGVRGYAEFSVSGIFATSTQASISGTTEIEKDETLSKLGKALSGELIAGNTYTVTEKNAPEGYKEAESFKFEVAKDGTVKSITPVSGTGTVAYVSKSDEGTSVGTNTDTVVLKVKDDPITLTVQKTNADGTKSLGGAVFTVTTEDGSNGVFDSSTGAYVESIDLPATSTDNADKGTVVLTGILKQGVKYILEEKTAPSGYERNSLKCYFYISSSYHVVLTDADGNDLAVANGKYTISAGSSGTEATVSYSAEANSTTITATDVLTSFTLKKTDQESGDDIVDTDLRLTVSAVDKSDATKSVFIWTHATAYDETTKTGGYALTPASGTAFTGIYSNLTINPSTGEITGLPSGDYVLSETVKPSGYLKATDCRFTVKDDGTLAFSTNDTSASAGTSSISNDGLTLEIKDPVIRGHVTLTKYLGDSSTTLAGATFTLYRQVGTTPNATNDEVIATNLKTGDNGIWSSKTSSEENKDTRFGKNTEAARAKAEANGNGSKVTLSEGLLEGTYYFQETGATADSKLNESLRSETFTISGESNDTAQPTEAKKVSVTNKAFTASLAINKKDYHYNGTGSLGVAADFTLTFTPEEPVGNTYATLTTAGWTATTGTDGKTTVYTKDVRTGEDGSLIIDGLLKGSYTLTETTATGYNSDSFYQYSFTITEDDYRDKTAKDGGEIVSLTKATGFAVNVISKNGTTGDTTGETSAVTPKVALRDVESNTIYNERLTGKVEITKADSADKNTPIDGAEFKLTLISTDDSRADKAVIEGFTFVTGMAYTYVPAATGGEASFKEDTANNTTGRLTISGLPWGTYKLTETKAISGYELPDEAPSIEFTFSKDSLTSLAETDGHSILNTKTNITINKVSAEAASTLLDGAEFQLYGTVVENGTKVTYEKDGATKKTLTARGGTLTLTGELITGEEYILEETKAPEGYELAQSTLTFKLKDDGTLDMTDDDVYSGNGTETITVKDTPIVLTLTKLDKDEDDKKLAGATFNLYEGDVLAKLNSTDPSVEKPTAVGTYTTDTDGVLTIQTTSNFKLKQGTTYTLEETTAPDGYELLAPFTFTLDGDKTPVGTAAIGSGTGTITVFSNVTLTGNISAVSYGTQATADTTDGSDQTSGKAEGTEKSGQTSSTQDKTALIVRDERIELAIVKADADGNAIDEEKHGNAEFEVSGKFAGTDKTTITGTTEIESGKTVSDIQEKLSGKLITGETYTVKETEAPGGYELAEAFKFTINSDGTGSVSSVTDADGESAETFASVTSEDGSPVVTITVKDEPIKVRFLKVSEYDKAADDAENAKQLHGAVFTVEPMKGSAFADGSTDSVTVSGADDEDTLSNVLNGVLAAGNTYTVTETKYPEGYKAMEDSFTVTVSKDGSVTVVNADETSDIAKAIDGSEGIPVIRVKNQPTDLFVVKEDENGKALEGAVFTVTPADGNSFADGTTAPRTLEKISEEIGECGIEDPVFRLYKTYILEETVAPDGYELPAYALKFYLDKDGIVHEGEYGADTKEEADPQNIYEVSGENEYIYVKDTPIEISIKKVDAENNTRIVSGAEFSIAPKNEEDSFADGTTAARALGVTNDDGILEIPSALLKSNVVYGLTETKAPNGYLRISSTWYFHVGTDGKVVAEKDQTDSAYAVSTEDPTQIVVEDPVIRGHVTLTKYLGDTKTTLAGATFDLYRVKEGTETEDVKIASGLTTGEDGVWSSALSDAVNHDTRFGKNAKAAGETDSETDASETETAESASAAVKLSEGLLAGTYYFQETGATADSKLNTALKSETFTISGDSENTAQPAEAKTVSVTNVNFTASLVINKADYDYSGKAEKNLGVAADFTLTFTPDEPAGNAEATLLAGGWTKTAGTGSTAADSTSSNTGTDGAAVYTKTVSTGADGSLTIAGLLKGSYTLTETAATGYDPESFYQYSFKITEDDYYDANAADGGKTVSLTNAADLAVSVVSAAAGSSAQADSGLRDTAANVIYNERLGGTVEIVKTDSVDAAAIDGAEFKLTLTSTDDGRADKTVIEGYTFVTGKAYVYTAAADSADKKASFAEDTANAGTGHLKISGLPWGTYTLTETKAADGYAIVGEAPSLTFTISGTALTQTAETDGHTLTNRRETQITVQKLDEDGNPLAGAVLELLDETGNVLEKWTSGAEAHVIVNTLEPGTTCTLREISAPAGYHVALDQTFTIPETMRITLTVTDKAVVPETETGSIEVTKIVTYSGLPAAVDGGYYAALFEDAAHTKRVSDVKYIDMNKSYRASVVFDGLTPGTTYYVAETDENGFVQSSEEHVTISYVNESCTVKSGETGQTEILNAYDVEFPDGYLVSGSVIRLTKKVTSGGGDYKVTASFYGALFADENYEVRVSEVKEFRFENSSSVEVKFEQLPNGRYYFMETDKDGNPVKSGDESFGYNLTLSASYVDIVDSDSTMSGTLTNEVIETEVTPTAAPTVTPTVTPAGVQSEAAKTGDDTDVTGLLALMFMALAAAAYAQRKRKRR